MLKKEKITTALRVIFLILLLINLSVAIFEEVGFINALYSFSGIINNPFLIVKLNLFFHPLLILLGIIGVFMLRKIGYILMLLLPFYIITYKLIPLFFGLSNFESIWIKLVLASIYLIILYSRGIRYTYGLKSLKIFFQLNSLVLLSMSLLSFILLYFKGYFV